MFVDGIRASAAWDLLEGHSLHAIYTFWPAYVPISWETQLAFVVHACRKYSAFYSQKAGVGSATRNLLDAVYEISETDNYWSVFFLAEESDSQLASVVSTTWEYFSIFWEKARMMCSTWNLFYPCSSIFQRELDGCRLTRSRDPDTDSTIFRFAPAVCLPAFVKCYREMLSTRNFLDFELRNQRRQLDVFQMLAWESQTKLAVLVGAHRIQMSFLRDKMCVLCTTADMLDEYVEAQRLRREHEIWVLWLLIITELSAVVCSDHAHLGEFTSSWVYQVYVVCCDCSLCSGLMLQSELIFDSLIQMGFHMAQVAGIAMCTARNWTGFGFQFVDRSRCSSFPSESTFLLAELWFGLIRACHHILWELWLAGLLIQSSSDAQISLVILTFIVILFIIEFFFVFFSAG